MRDDANQKAGTHDGKQGDVSIRLGLPGGANIDANFSVGAPAAALAAAVLNSAWAEESNPWGVRLNCTFPRRTLTESDAVTKDMHKSKISVQEIQPPQDDEDIFQDPLVVAAAAGTP